MLIRECRDEWRRHRRRSIVDAEIIRWPFKFVNTSVKDH